MVADHNYELRMSCIFLFKFLKLSDTAIDIFLIELRRTRCTIKVKITKVESRGNYVGI